MKKGNIFIISSPSGGGKSTLTGILTKSVSGICRAVTCTTRFPRPGEKNGRDYHFLTENEFKRKIAGSNFAEWARVHNHLYGTLRSSIEQPHRQGRDVILTIDPQGARAIKKIYAAAIRIFLMPPSLKVLEKRLRQRGGDAKSAIKVRLANSKKEIANASSYDYIVINDNKQRAVNDLKAIICAERLRNIK